MGLFQNIGGLLAPLVTPKAGGSPAGNLLRSITNTQGQGAGATALGLGNLLGGLIGGGSKTVAATTGQPQQGTGALAGLPSIKDILGGAAKGAAGTLQNSEAGQAAQQQAVSNYLQANAYKFITWILGIALVVIGAVYAFKSQKGGRR